jgi:fatty acid desaturase
MDTEEMMSAIDILHTEIRAGASPGGAEVRLQRIDWPTLGLAIGVYGAFAALTWFARDLPWAIILPLGAVIVCLQSSLQHEAVHGYPTPWRWVNYAIAAPALWLWMPYGINRRSHLQHHHDESLTDPSLDPESNYISARDWAGMSGAHRTLRRLMATLLGRIAIGPVYYAARALSRLVTATLRGDRQLLMHWAIHGAVMAALLWWVVRICGISVAEYIVLFAWPGTGLALIRSFAEHRAAPDVAARTATVEAGWFMRFLYLNNNLHALHHADPHGAWHQRPAAYRRQRAEVLGRSRYNLVPGYAVLFRNHMLEPKEPLLHPAETRSRAAVAPAPVEGSLAAV